MFQMLSASLAEALAVSYRSTSRSFRIGANRTFAATYGNYHGSRVTVPSSSNRAKRRPCCYPPTPQPSSYPRRPHRTLTAAIVHDLTRRSLSIERGIDAPYPPLPGQVPGGNGDGDPDPRLSDVVVRVRSHPSDRNVRTYLLLPRELPPISPRSEGSNTTTKETTDADILSAINRSALASLRLSGSVLIGARVHAPDMGFLPACRPLVERALLDAGEGGKQPQAVAALFGLCDWARECIDRDGDGSATLGWLMERMRGEAGVADDEEKKGEDDSDRVRAEKLYEAVRAIATGRPRPGHKVLGAGTYRDARPAWEALAKEFSSLPLCREAELYRSVGGEMVGVEWLAETSEVYMKEAGGTMVRFFFL